MGRNQGIIMERNEFIDQVYCMCVLDKITPTKEEIRALLKERNNKFKFKYMPHLLPNLDGDFSKMKTIDVFKPGYTGKTEILPTKEEVDALLNDPEVIELTDEEIIEKVFDRR